MIDESKESDTESSVSSFSYFAFKFSYKGQISMKTCLTCVIYENNFRKNVKSIKKILQALLFVVII